MKTKKNRLLVRRTDTFSGVNGDYLYHFDYSNNLISFKIKTSDSEINGEKN